jgi:hypothetical protein
MITLFLPLKISGKAKIISELLTFKERKVLNLNKLD